MPLNKSPKILQLISCTTRPRSHRDHQERARGTCRQNCEGKTITMGMATGKALRLVGESFSYPSPDFLSRCLRRRAPGIAPGKQAAAEEGAFQRTIAVHAAAAEAGRFAGGIKPRHDLAVAAEYARVEVGLEPAQRLAGQDIEFHRTRR